MRVVLFLGLAAATQLNPITRVAQLLEGLSKKVEQDGKAEQDLYDQYKCWCTKVIDSKTASIEANKLRIAELAADIDDLENGRVELTSERETYEAEIKELQKAIADAEAMRTKENEDYVAAKDEMDKAITALTSAVNTMKAGAPTGLMRVSSELKHAMQFGSGFLAKRDVDSLEKVLATEVPEVDWNKLNREATFKQNYTSRSGKIQDILADMLQTFEDNRDEAVSAENKAASDHSALMTAKKNELGAAQQSLLDQNGENGARGAKLATDKAEKKEKEDQNTRDVTFLADTKTACNTKAQEWTTRKGLRAGEVAAISQALGILRSDDARDLFKKSFDNDSFLQVDESHSPRSRAMALIRRTAKLSKDSRLNALVLNMAMRKKDEPADVTADPFADVITAIDAMVTDLKSEEASDLQKKETCESDRMTNTQTAKMTSKNIDTHTESIDRLEAEIAASKKVVADLIQQIADLTEEGSQADIQRNKEKKEFEQNKQDDTDAAALVTSAVDVLKNFYANNNLALVQQSPTEGFVAAGEAPTPPPSTWDSGYGGATGEKNGIIGIMELIADDINKDITKATANEATAVSEYNKLKSDIAAEISSLNSQKATENGNIGTAEGDRTTEKTGRTTDQGTLTSTIDFLKSIAPGCDFIAVNFGTRLANRQAEMDGLLKAKAILQGAQP